MSTQRGYWDIQIKATEEEKRQGSVMYGDIRATGAGHASHEHSAARPLPLAAQELHEYKRPLVLIAVPVEGCTYSLSLGPE